MKKVLFIFCLFIVSTSMAYKEGGGGGTVPLRKAEIESLLEGGDKAQIKSKLRILVGMANMSGLPQSVKSDYQAVVSRGLVNDLKSPYKIIDSSLTSEKCMAEGVQVPASSGMNELGGEICFDKELLVRDNTSLNELVGLAFHEHAHHFGFADKNHKLAFWVSQLNQQFEFQKPTGVISYTNPSSSTVCTVGITFGGQIQRMYSPANIDSVPNIQFSDVTSGKERKIGSRVVFEIPCGQERMFFWRLIASKKGGWYAMSIDINGVSLWTDDSKLPENQNRDGGNFKVTAAHWERYKELTGQL